MSLLYSKLRLQIPQVSDGKNAIITSPRGVNRSVPMTYPLTDVFVGGMDKYTVQAGTGSESFSVGNGKFKKIVTEDASALAVASMPTKSKYLVGENLDLSGVTIDATIQKGDGTSETRDVTSQCDFDPTDGTELYTAGTQQINVEFGNVSSFFNVQVMNFLIKNFPTGTYASTGAFCVFNNELHWIGGSSAGKHLKFNGLSWETASTLPQQYRDHGFQSGGVLVYENGIHIFGGISNGIVGVHYRWDGTSWTTKASMPDTNRNFAYCVYDGKILVCGGYGTYYNQSLSKIYFYDLTTNTWSHDYTKYTVPNSSKTQYAGIVVYNNELYWIGGANSYTASEASVLFYKRASLDSPWVRLSDMPSSFLGGQEMVVVYDNAIYRLGSYDSNYINKIYKFDGSSWQIVGEKPTGGKFFTTIGNYIVGGYINNNNVQTAQWDGTSWTMGT